MSKDNAHEVYIDDKGAQFILVNKERVYINDKSQEQINITKGRASSDRSLSEDPNDLIRLYNSDNSGQLSRIYWDTDDNLRWLVNTNDIYIHPEGGDGSGTVHLQTDLLVGDPNNPDAGGEIRHNGRINAKYNPQVGEPAHWLGTSYDGDNTYNLSSLDYMVINPPNGTTFDYFQRFRSEGQDKFKVSKEGKTTIRGDGTLLDLQDSDSNSKLTFDGDNLTVGNVTIDGQTDTSSYKNGQIKFANGGYLRGYFGSVTLASGNKMDFYSNNKTFLQSKNGRVLFGGGDENNLTSTVTIGAKSGQTDPLLQLNDETGSQLYTQKTNGQTQITTPSTQSLADGGTLELRNLVSDSTLNGPKLVFTNNTNVQRAAIQGRQENGNPDNARGELLFFINDGGGSTVADKRVLTVSNGNFGFNTRPQDDEQYLFQDPETETGDMSFDVVSSGRGLATHFKVDGEYDFGGSNNILTISNDENRGYNNRTGIDLIQDREGSGETQARIAVNGSENGFAFHSMNHSGLIASLTGSGDQIFHQNGKGVILTSPDGNTTKRVYLDNSGTLQTEAV